MKKNLVLIFILVLALSLAGCGETAGINELSDSLSAKDSGAAKGPDGLEEGTGTEPAVQTAEMPESEPVTELETKPETEPETAWEWQYDLPENHGLDSNAPGRLHEALDPTQVLASVIVKDGYIVDEYYKEGRDENSVFLLHSCSKSVTSALIGIAIDRGYIESVDVPISEYFPQIAKSGSEYLKQVTIWHLLTHTSGISSADTDVWEDWRSSENWVDYVLERPVTSEPGTVFSYTTGGTHLLSAILQKATGKTVYDFGREYLFDPVGMDSVQCDTDAQGISDGGNGFYMDVYDMARFGQLYLNGGVWEGRQIIPQEWVQDSTSLQFKRSTGTADYGYQWWVRKFGEQGYDAYFAQGHFGQYIFVVPDLELVIVFTSSHTGSSSMYWQFVTDITDACEAR